MGQIRKKIKKARKDLLNISKNENTNKTAEQEMNELDKILKKLMRI